MRVQKTLREVLRDQHDTGLAGLEIRGIDTSSCVEHAFYHGMLITVEYDDYRENPRRDYETFGRMVCAHNRYDLGDKDAKEIDLYNALSNHVTHNMEDEYIDDSMGREIRNRRYVDPDDMSAVVVAAIKAGFVVLPLYLYDHGGLSMSTSSFSCPWDSGCVGFIYATPTECEEFMPTGWEQKSPQVQGKMRKAARDKAEAALESAVEVYDKYLSGEVYRFATHAFTVQYDPAVDENFIEVGDAVDSCCGFYEEPESVIEEAAVNSRIYYELALTGPYTLPIPMGVCNHAN